MNTKNKNMRLKYTLALATVALFTLSFVSNINLRGTNIKNACKEKIIEKYGTLKGFEITAVKAAKANQVKLALGTYADQTTNIVIVDYQSEKGDKQCSCLFDSNGKLLVTSDEIEY
jgi:hypothetical protein